MNRESNMREKIISQPSYWVEQINGELYDSIMNYMDVHKMKQKDLAKYLGISTGRMSQIINDGDINFSLEKIIQIALKIGKIPSFRFQDKKEFLEGETESEFKGVHILTFEFNQLKSSFSDKESKLISLNNYSTSQQEIVY
jgi:predicted XRE-type DNA-binding protein